MKKFFQNFSSLFRELLESLGFNFYELKPPPKKEKTVYSRNSHKEKLPEDKRQKIARHEQHK